MENSLRLSAVRQTFPAARIPSLKEALQETLGSLEASSLPLSGKRIAVAVGSRGISRIDEIVRELLAFLRRKGAAPFIVPAMGSHGGAGAEGQEDVLRSYGVSSEAMGVEVLSSMEVEHLGSTDEGIPVAIDRTAWSADGIILVNRIKPHTDFKGTLGSGLMKMIAVGLGNAVGARHFHSSIRRWKHETVISAKARFVLSSGKVLAGLAIVENADHETALVEAIPADRIFLREQELFEVAQELMPSLPIEELDLLIIDRIGKDISGAGMDPNVTGRWFRFHSRWQEAPEIARILVRDLSEKTHGNGLGIGLADFCTERAAGKLNRPVTYANAVTSQNIVTAHLPLQYESDRSMIQAAIESLGQQDDPSGIRLIRIRDTLNLRSFWASEAATEQLRGHPRVDSISDPQPLSFDRHGNFPEE